MVLPYKDRQLLLGDKISTMFQHGVVLIFIFVCIRSFHLTSINLGVILIRLAPCFNMVMIISTNRVGGKGLFPLPSSHTTVRAVRHTAVR